MPTQSVPDILANSTTQYQWKRKSERLQKENKHMLKFISPTPKSRQLFQENTKALYRFLSARCRGTCFHLKQLQTLENLRSLLVFGHDLKSFANFNLLFHGSCSQISDQNGNGNVSAGQRLGIEQDGVQMAEDSRRTKICYLTSTENLPVQLVCEDS